MVIEKVLNNNVVISKNERGEEIICMAKASRFKKDLVIGLIKQQFKKNLF